MAGRVAVLGAGRMGSAAAERLASLSFDVVVWNRTREKAEALARRIGARVAGSVEEAAGFAEYAISFLADDDAVMSVASRIPGGGGLVYIEMSTITPKTARAVGALLESRGACFLHAPVLGGPGKVRSGELIILAAGRRACLDRARPVLDALSTRIVPLGEDPAAAAAAKLAYNNLLISSIAAAAESLALLEAYGLEPGVFREVTSGTVFAGFTEKYLPRMLSEESKASFEARLAAKDAEYASRTLREAGIPALVSTAAAQAYTLASALGYASHDYTSIAKMLISMLKPRGKSEGGKP
ncbi:NAD(P)-dependent oxidoreductase [Stetteria hydrogenophila]